MPIDFDESGGPRSARARELRDPMVIVLMGVAGSGKTTVGLKLADALGWAFRDADDFHPKENVAKMTAGIPLEDRDRGPWLAAIRRYIAKRLERGESAVVTCSALRQSYREQIVTDPARVKLVQLAGNFELILQRMEARQGHFMKAEMLRSQFATLEPPTHALVADITKSPDEIVADIRRALAV